MSGRPTQPARRERPVVRTTPRVRTAGTPPTGHGATGHGATGHGATAHAAAGHPAAPAPGTTSPARRTATPPPAAPSTTRLLPRARAVVPTASVLAFAARARPRRRPSRRSLTTVLATVAVLLVAGWVVLVSPLLAARDVQVVGTTRLDPAQVTALVDPDLGTPLARLDVGAVADRVEQLPLVADAEVLRSWPGSVEVRVTEREPVAAIAAPSGTTLVDASGRHLLDVPEAPADLPTLSPETVAAGEGSIDAAVSVLHDLPTDLLAQVAGTDARTPDSVTLTLRSGATVVWGSADDSPEKAAVLAVLLGSPAGTYDVSAPRTPVTR